MTNSRTFGAAAAQVAANGYEPLPVFRRQKNPSITEDWPHYRFDPADLDRYRDHGIGILTRLTPAADIDVREPQLESRLERLAVEMLGAAPKRVGAPPKCLLLYRLEGEPFAKIQTRGYRLPGDPPPDPQRKLKAHHVELLADGEQFVAYNIHMDTGKPYTWNGVGEPLTVPVADLAPITREKAAAFIEACEAVLAEVGTPVGRLQQSDCDRSREPNEQLVAEDPAKLRRALAFIKNDDLDYDDWIHVGLALKGALGEDGEDDFVRWSAQSTKDDERLTRVKWKSFEPNRIGAGSIFHWAKDAGFDGKGVEPFAIELVTSLATFIRLELPPREPIIEGFLFKQSILEFWGFRGCGKTWFGLFIAKAIAEGTQFLLWSVPASRRVLYVDGEMAGRELQDRLKAMFGDVVPEKFELMASEVFYQATDSSLVINDAIQQQRFEGLLDSLKAAGRDPEVIIFDNLSALTVGIDENSSTEFQTLKAWFTRLRHKGYVVIFVHHAGKAGDQRGTSGREDNLDMTIKLAEPETRTETTRIKMEVDKCRSERPKPDRVEIALVTDPIGRLVLAIETEAKRRENEDIPIRYHILKHISLTANAQLKEMQTVFNIGRTQIYAVLNALRKERLLSEQAGPLKLTPTGNSKVERLWPGETPL